MNERWSHYLSWTYHCSGLGGLIRIGADFVDICNILREDRRNNGMTEEDDRIATQACKAAEKTANGLIIHIPNEKWRCVTDYLYGSFNQFVVVTPTKAIIHPFMEMDMALYDMRNDKNLKRVDDMYYIGEQPHELVEFFRNYKR